MTPRTTGGTRRTLHDAHLIAKDRMTRSRNVRPGLPSTALLAILAITAAWWGLALWPAGAATPEWLLRTRAVCFGSMSNGLPDVGGWIVLIGEPIGMLGFLVGVWGEALREDLRRLRVDPRSRLALRVLAMAGVAGVLATAHRVGRASGLLRRAPVVQQGVVSNVDINLSKSLLVDQHGERASPAGFPGGPAILAFAFGHCTTVCPAVVHDVRSARTSTGRTRIPLVVITLDPWRDTPEHLPMIASAWELGPQDRVLSGSIESVERVLDALDVQRWRDSRTGNIEHANVIMITDGRGRVVHRLDGWWGRVDELLTMLPAS